MKLNLFLDIIYMIKYGYQNINVDEIFIQMNMGYLYVIILKPAIVSYSDKKELTNKIAFDDITFNYMENKIYSPSKKYFNDAFR